MRSQSFETFGTHIFAKLKPCSNMLPIRAQYGLILLDFIFKVNIWDIVPLMVQNNPDRISWNYLFNVCILRCGGEYSRCGEGYEECCAGYECTLIEGMRSAVLDTSAR